MGKIARMLDAMTNQLTRLDNIGELFITAAAAAAAFLM